MATTRLPNGERSLIPDYANQRRSTFWIVALVLIVLGVGIYLTSGVSGRYVADIDAGPSTPQPAPATPTQ